MCENWSRLINGSGGEGERYRVVDERVEMREGAERRTMNENVCGCQLSVNLELELIGPYKDREVKEIDLFSSNLQNKLHEEVKTIWEVMEVVGFRSSPYAEYVTDISGPHKKMVQERMSRLRKKSSRNGDLVTWRGQKNHLMHISMIKIKN